jgi:hypothetical protein
MNHRTVCRLQRELLGGFASIEELDAAIEGELARLTPEEPARIMACTSEEATAWLREAGNEPGQALTVESVAASLWHFVNDRADGGDRRRCRFSPGPDDRN